MDTSGLGNRMKRQFIQLSRAWYSEPNLRDQNLYDEIMIGFYHDDGGTTGEFVVRWIDIGHITPRLEVFDDAWSALWNCNDLLEKLAELDGQDVMPTQFCEILKSLGIEDATPTQNPYGD